MSTKHKLREFIVIDATDDSGLHAEEVSDSERAFFEKFGKTSATNSFFVREVDPEADKLRDELVNKLKVAQRLIHKKVCKGADVNSLACLCEDALGLIEKAEGAKEY